MKSNLKEKVLFELIQGMPCYCSGEKISRKLGVSRTAIWKTVQYLEDEGCRMDCITNRGYLLLEIPDMYSGDYLLSLLEKDTHTNWQIQHFEKLDSTNRLAKQLAVENAPTGTVIIADQQENGRGRMGRDFYSPKGGLYFSVIERLDLSVSSMMSVTACTAAAVHQALQKFGVVSQIKWVNDLFLNHKKICGILSEGSFNAETNHMDYLVIGIGINLHPDPDCPEELKAIASDVETETGIEIRRCDLAAEILIHLEKYLDQIAEHTYLETYTANSCTLGHQVRTDKGEEGFAEGFTNDAGLIIRKANGTKKIICTGSAAIID